MKSFKKYTLLFLWYTSAPIMYGMLTFVMFFVIPKNKWYDVLSYFKKDYQQVTKKIKEQ
jgi:hypothetical protein